MHFLRVVAVAGVALFAPPSVGCSSDNAHSPFANARCAAPPCAMPSVSAGQAGPGGGGADAGVAVRDAGTATGSGCIVDQTTRQTLCATTSTCTDFTLDRTLFPDCGFVTPAGLLQLVCGCTSTGLSCPIAVQVECDVLTSRVGSAVDETTLCNTQAAAGACTLPTGAGGSGGAGGGSSCLACQAACMTDPLCLSRCVC